MVSCDGPAVEEPETDTMIPLPIVERELRVAARRRAFYWGRMGAGLVAVAVGVVLLPLNRQTPPALLSQYLLVTLGVLALALCLLAGVFLTADCLSEEQREGTLGLIFLTDLKGYDVTLGKLIATSAQASYALLAICPMLALPLLLGGVTGGELGRVILVLLTTLFFSLSLGLVVSALNRDAHQAMVGTVVGLLVVAGLPPFLWSLRDHLLGRHPPTGLLLPCPGYTFYAAFDSSYRTRSGAGDFWTSLGLVFLIGLGCLVAATVLLPRVWRENRRPATQPSGLARLWKRATRPRSAPGPVSARQRQIDPCLWLASRSGTAGGLERTVLALTGAVWLCTLAVAFAAPNGRKNDALATCALVAYAAHQVFKFIVAAEATRRFSEDRRSGAVELLLVSPLQETKILAGQRRALNHRLARPRRGLVLMNLCLLGLFLIFAKALRLGWDGVMIVLEWSLGGIALLACDFRALVTVGMRAALSAKNHSRAVLSTLGQVMLPPWLAILGLSVLDSCGPAGSIICFGLWIAVGLLTDLVVSARANRALRRGLRHCLRR